MSRYADVQKAVFSVFGSTAWTKESLPTFPSDIVPTGAGNEYIRVTIIPGSVGINTYSISGICIIDIFTAFGEGPTRAFEIADKLDEYLNCRTISLALVRNVQFRDSTMVPKGKDTDNGALTRHQYTIPFNLFGV